MRRQRATTASALAAPALAVAAAMVLGLPGPGPAAAAAAPNAVRAAYPVTVPSGTGTGTVRIKSRPTRILSLSASATQMLYAVGAGNQVVGVDKYSTYPPNAPRTKFTGFESSAEDYLYLQPDLVIFAFKEGTLVQQLKDLGIPAVVLGPATTIAGADSQMAELGVVTGHDTAARRAERSLGADLTSAVRAAHGAGRGQSYYLELENDYYTATSKTFIGAELSLFGMRDIADAAGHGTAYPKISAEYVLKENPDYVFLADSVCCHQTAASFAHRPGFKTLRAVKSHHVIAVNDSAASEWGPHTIETFVAKLARVLHP
ncbi:MAG: ABC transporter substrate-binding protein [Acidimicrobiales bacterium]